MSLNKNRKFRFAIDRGGTFTDIYAEVPGEPGVRVVKLLSEDPKKTCFTPQASHLPTILHYTAIL